MIEVVEEVGEEEEVAVGIRLSNNLQILKNPFNTMPIKIS